MKHKTALTALVAASIMSGTAVAQNPAKAKVRARGGFALQLDASTGGDGFTTSERFEPETTLGEGIAVSVGGFYRPSVSKPWEIQAFIGYKTGWIVPVRGGGGEERVSRSMLRLLANYRNEDQWYFGGGLVVHGSPTYENTIIHTPDVNFDTAVGAMIEGGWSWLGVQCTYIKYQASQYGKLDASNCGVRFTWRFRKWGPLR
jgi:hypothetical protein